MRKKEKRKKYENAKNSKELDLNSNEFRNEAYEDQQTKEYESESNPEKLILDSNEKPENEVYEDHQTKENELENNKNSETNERKQSFV